VLSRSRWWAALAAPLALALSGCGDFVIVAPTATPNAAATQTLPPIGFNHRYGNDPISAADGFALERTLFSASEFWEVAVGTDPQLAGFVDRSNPAAVVAARAKVTTMRISLGTERLNTIQGMLAYPQDTGQEQYCIAIVDHFRALGYTSLTKATLYVFFTEADLHATLGWTRAGGYSFKVFDNDLRGNSFRPGPTATPLPVTH
jgi:hypothetical protein